MEWYNYEAVSKIFNESLNGQFSIVILLGEEPHIGLSEWESFYIASIAQLVEQFSLKRWVMVKDKDFYRRIGEKGILKRKQNIIDKYLNNPNKCKECGKSILPLEGENIAQTKRKLYCSDECRHIGMSKSHLGNQNRLKEKPKCLNCGKTLSYSRGKFCCISCHSEYNYNQYITKWKNNEVSGLTGKYQIHNYIRRYLYSKYNHKCARCGWNEVNPYTKKIPLEAEHIDGNYLNNDEENLTLLCPNCHSLTSTYKGANLGNGRESRRKNIEV